MNGVFRQDFSAAQLFRMAGIMKAFTASLLGNPKEESVFPLLPPRRRPPFGGAQCLRTQSVR